MSKTEMINYLSKEIETLSTTTMEFRNKIAFSLWIGPFLILGSIIVATKSGLNLHFHTKGAWIAAISAALAFWALGIMTGQVEAGAWNKCNEWRRCIIKLQGEEKLTTEELEAMILYEPIVHKITRVYTIVFLIILLTFGATAYLAKELVQGESVTQQPQPAAVKPAP